MNYTLELQFDGERHCLRCPLKNDMNDSCNMQPDSDDFENWNEQLEGCPLVIK